MKKKKRKEKKVQNLQNLYHKKVGKRVIDK